MKAVLVYPEFPATFWSFRYALKFIHRKASSPPLGLLTIAAMLPEAREKRLVDMNVENLHDYNVLSDHKDLMQHDQSYSFSAYCL